MNSRLLVTALFLVSVATGILTLNSQTASRSRPAQRADAQARQPALAPALPEHVPYMFLFHHLVFLKQKADEIERQGKGKSALLSRFQEDAKLTPAQFQQLYLIAADCEQKVAEQDTKAKAIIDAMRARYPDGKIPEGETPPPVPPELLAMQQERDAIVLRARGQLQQALGVKAFASFDTFVQSRVAADVKPALPR